MAKAPVRKFSKKDIFSGVVIALVSIPISMGYAQIAGLPPVYGLYGSLLPIFIYALITSSKQFIVGVDAMPAAMVGSILAQMDITAQSKEALCLVPAMALMVSVWLFILYFLKAGRIVRYISVPVMGGFISGVGATIIMMQVPKLFGGSAGTGEITDLLTNIFEQRGEFHLLSFILGFGTILIILICKKFIPRVPMTVVMMAAGALAQFFFKLDQYGVKVMAEVPAGLPSPVLPGFIFEAGAAPKLYIIDIPGIFDFIPDLLMGSLGIAAVIMAQTLLASGNYARKYSDTLDNNRELLAYGAMNLGAAFVGSCPVNGSVSRSGIADSLGTRSQLTSVVAAITMILVLLFGTPLLKYLPVPVLTGIVITALIGIIEIPMAKKLWKIGKNELLVFIIAFLGVLFFGTLYGVMIGVLLSFSEVAMRSVAPPATFAGRIPGHGNFYSLKRNSEAKPIKNTVIYRFSGNLFFANIDLFCESIEAAIKEDTHQVVIDARGIGNIDVTAVERLLQLYKSLKERGILFYITEHDGSLNDQLRKMGGEVLIEEGAIRRTITLALRDAGLEKPYELEGYDPSAAKEAVGFEADDRLSEFEWVFGEEAEEKMQQMARGMAEKIAAEEDSEANVLNEEGLRTDWGMLGRFDEDAFWDYMEIHLAELADEGKIDTAFAARLERHIEKRREFGRKKLAEMNPHAAKLLKRHGEVLRNYLKHKHPKEFETYLEVSERRKK